jgi:two-component system response regulator NreC
MVGRNTRVLVVDDHPLFREGLVVAIERESDLEVAGEAGTMDQVRELATGVEIDLATVDVLMPSVSGLSITRQLLESHPHCHVLALSVAEDACVIAQMLRAGACGFALKTQPAAEIIAAIRATAASERYLPPGVSREAIETELATGTATLLTHLTKREREIFELIIRGYTNAEIAARLFIALRTVETHRHRITKKLSARSIVEMQRIAARYGGLGA